MKKKYWVASGIVLGMAVSVVGCSKPQDMSYLEERIVALETRNEVLEERIVELESDVILYLEELWETASEVFAEQKDEPTILDVYNSNDLLAEDYFIGGNNFIGEDTLLGDEQYALLDEAVYEASFTLYTVSADTDEEWVVDTVSINTALPLEGQLQILADSLSVACFESLPIKVVAIEIHGDKQIAVINLQEPDAQTTSRIIELYNSDPAAWCWYRYAQGSAGSYMTTTTLYKTFLQAEYTGEWIDGIKLLYNGGEEIVGHLESIGMIIER